MWIDPETSAACFRCPECEANGVARDRTGRPVALPEVEDTTQQGNPVVVELSHGEYAELMRCDMPHDGAEELLLGAERIGPGVRIAGDYDRMRTLRTFAQGRAGEYRGRRIERYECLRRVAEVVGDEL